MQLCEDEGRRRGQQKFCLKLWGAEQQFDWIGATVKTTRFICVVRASRISPYYWREKMRFDCVFLSIIRRLQVAHDHHSIFRDHGPIKTAVGWRICGRSMFTALRITNNNHVPAAQHWFQQLWRRLRLLLELQPTDIIKVLQTARFSILQIIFVLGENFNFFISPEDSGVAASALWFILQWGGTLILLKFMKRGFIWKQWWSEKSQLGWWNLIPFVSVFWSKSRHTVRMKQNWDVRMYGRQQDTVGWSAGAWLD